MDRYLATKSVSLGPAQVLAKPILDLSDSDRNHWDLQCGYNIHFVATLSIGGTILQEKDRIESRRPERPALC
jgi:hypothetical protein